MFEQYIANNYARFIVVLIGLSIIFRVVLFVISRAALFFTKKTSTELDDKIIEKSSKPLTIVSFLIALRISIVEIPLQELTHKFIFNSIYTSLVITISFWIFILINAVMINALRRVAKKTKSRIDDTLISLVNSVVNIALVVLSLIYILDVWGVEIGPLLAGLGIAGIAIALALQPVLSNIFSGAAVVLDQSIRVGDLIYLDSQTKGRIEKIGLRSTKIKTFDNELLIVPNNKIADSVLQNVALPEPKSRVVIQFSVAYGSDVEEVKKIVTEEIKSVKLASKEPEPLVRFLEMADSGLNFKAYFFVDSFEDRFPAIDEANTKIYNALNKARISIPFPQLDIHIKKEIKIKNKKIKKLTKLLKDS